MVAALAASRSDAIAFVIMLAGTGGPGEDILTTQLELILRAEGATEADIQKGLALQQRTFNAVRADEGWEELEAAIKKELAPPKAAAQGH